MSCSSATASLTCRSAASDEIQRWLAALEFGQGFDWMHQGLFWGLGERPINNECGLS
jgi:hypothetical protein